MKKSPFLLAMALALGLHLSASAQILVSPTGFPAIPFNSLPILPAAEWASSLTLIGTGGTNYTNSAEITAAVQTLDQSSISSPIERVITNTAAVPAEAFQHNITAGFLISASSGVGASLLKATLRNNTTQAISHVQIGYNFGVFISPSGETAPGHQAFFSTNGLPGGWQPIPSFSGLNAAAPVSATLFVGRWLPNTDIYLLWADDNAVNNPDGGYTIDNFSSTGVTTTNVMPLPLSVALSSPVNGTVAFPPVTVSANAAGTPTPTSVSFYTNGVLAAIDTNVPYSLTYPTLASGTYTIYAVVSNGSAFAYSGTNTVRVRPEFAQYIGGTYTENFNGMAASGVETPFGWYGGINLPASIIDVTADDGSVGASAAVTAWNFGTSGSGERALGMVATGFERDIVLRLRNNTAGSIISFTLFYDGEVWRNYTNPPVVATLTNYVSYDLGATWIPTGPSFNFTQPFPPAFPQGPVNGNNSTNQQLNIGGVITPPSSIPTGGVIYFRWQDINDAGTDGGLAIDNVRISATLRPTNDTCVGAIALTSGVPYSQDATNASNDGEQGLSGCAGLVNGVWFTITPSATGTMTVSTCNSDFQTEVVVYRGTCNTLVSYRCGFGGDFSCFNVARGNVEAPVTAGETYLILVGGAPSANPNSGNVNVLATVYPPPSNDQCSGATVMSPGQTYYVNTYYATTNGDPTPTCAIGSGFGKGVWYRITPNANGRITISTCGSDFDTVVQVYTGADCASLTPLNGGTCRNGANCGSSQNVVFDSIGGTTYWILVGGSGDVSGNLSITATVCEVPYGVSASSVLTVESNGVRVFYYPSVNGTPPFSYNWTFKNASGATLFTANTETVDRFYGPFDEIPASFTLTNGNACGSGSGSGGLPTCGAICLSVGIPQTYTGTNGSGPNSALATPCGISGTSGRWFQITTLTNASGMAMVSTEGSTYDTVLGVYRGSFSSPGSLFSVGCNDNIRAGNSNSLVRFETRPGSNYWLVVNPPPAGRTLKLTYGYEVKIDSLSYNNTNRVFDLRSGPLASSPYQYRLLAATNLTATAANWSNLFTTNFAVTNSASSNILRYLDTNSPGSIRRFYRIQRLP